ncbi:retroviral-like aspartic protease family protein [Candidatus Roizmanbacteria bacterium]|nr:retroviral-like aspartic protease family protein [Candidatus Roizmanbacteria bacterium]
MSLLKFNPRTSSIILDAYLEGKIALHAKFVLDTGASFVVLPWWIATGLGLKINPKNLTSTTTASSVENVPLTTIPKITVLNKTARNVFCIIKDLPSDAGVDGLLGLSYLRNFNLYLNFKRGNLRIE